MEGDIVRKLLIIIIIIAIIIWCVSGEDKSKQPENQYKQILTTYV